MTQPKQARSRGSKRYYEWRAENYWSVTSIIGGGVPKPALINWAKKYTAEYAVEHFDAFSTLVNSDPDGAVDWLKGAAYRDRDRKADLGSLVHAAAEAYSLGKPFPKWPLEVRPRMESYLRFLEDFQPTFEMTEESVFNKTERYAGTLDAIITIDGRRLIMDAKTGKAIYPESALQLAAYRNAEFVGAPDGSEKEMPEVDGAVGLHLTDEGYDLIEIDAGPDVYRYFLYCREVFRWAEEKSKQVLLGPYPVSLELAV